jgi:hypothetical protein
VPNRYQFQSHLPLSGSANRKHAVGEAMDLATATAQGRRHRDEEDPGTEELE